MADKKKQAQILSQVPLFSGLSVKQLDKFANSLKKRTYEQGAEIIQQGTGGEGLFILSEGSAKAERTLPDGEQVIVNEFTKGDFFGELALLDDGLRTASVIATTPVECAILIRWEFQAILKNEPEMAVFLLEELARRFRRTLEIL